jgi:hypothetical protein
MSPETCYVAYLDILGTRHLISTDPARFGSLFESFLKIIEDSRVDIAPKIGFHAKLEVRAFQDSILMYWPDREAGEESRLLEFGNVAQFLSWMFVEAFDRGLPLRGAVSHGSVFRTPHGIYGAPIASAAKWHDASNWIGIVFAPDLDPIIELDPVFLKTLPFRDKFGFDLQRKALGPIVKYTVPVKSPVEPTSRWVVDWPIYVAEQTLSNDRPGDPFAVVRAWFDSGAARCAPTTDGARNKHRNAVRFIEHCLRDNPMSKDEVDMLGLVRGVRQKIKARKDQ